MMKKMPPKTVKKLTQKNKLKTSEMLEISSIIKMIYKYPL